MDFQKKNLNSRIVNINRASRFIRYINIAQLIACGIQIIISFSSYRYLSIFFTFFTIPAAIILIYHTSLGLKRLRCVSKLTKNDEYKKEVYFHSPIAHLYSQKMIKKNEHIFIPIIIGQPSVEDMFKAELIKIQNLIDQFGIVNYQLVSVYDIYLILIIKDLNESNYFRLMNDDFIISSEKIIHAFPYGNDMCLVHYNSSKLLEKLCEYD